MSRYRFAEIHCDIRLFMKTAGDEKLCVPFKHDDYFRGPFTLMSECIRISKSEGWKVRRILGVRYDFCPVCVHSIDVLRAKRVMEASDAEDFDSTFPYYWAWGQYPQTELRHEKPWQDLRKGQRCRVLVRSRRMNSALIQFEDGYQMVSSRNGLRKAKV